MNDVYLSNINSIEEHYIAKFVDDELVLTFNKVLTDPSNKQCYILLKYIDNILDKYPINEIVKLSILDDEKYKSITKKKPINSGAYGIIYAHENNKVIKQTIFLNLTQIFFLVIILNLENLNKLIPRIHELQYYHINGFNKFYVYITMDKYKYDLDYFIKSELVSFDESAEFIKKELIKLLFRLYKNNLICADIKLKNIVINHNIRYLISSIDIDIDIKLIDIELDFCRCLEDKDMNNDNAIIFVQYYLYFLNMETKNRLLKLKNKNYNFDDLLYEFLTIFNKYFQKFELINFCIKPHFIETPRIVIQYHRINLYKLVENFQSLHRPIIHINTFKFYNLEKKIKYLNLSDDIINMLKTGHRYLISRQRYNIIINFLFFLCLFGMSAPLRYYMLEQKDKTEFIFAENESC